MSNTYFQFKQFIVHQDRCAMKVTTDACLFGAWVGNEVRSLRSELRSVLDIGAGTGLLSLMLAQKISEANFDAIEIDKDSFEQAKGNISASPWADRIKIIHADAKEFSCENKYDLIISNPPFYENELKGENKKKNIAHHSDELSLTELIAIIKKNLMPDGVFYLLLPYKRNQEFETLVKQHEIAVRKILFVRQSVNHDYFRIMLEGILNTNDTAETIIEEIAIWNDQQQYTPRFIGLLKDYYLHL